MPPPTAPLVAHLVQPGEREQKYVPEKRLAMGVLQGKCADFLYLEGFYLFSKGRNFRGGSQ